ncbi:hypothetical protein J6590_048565 [Homalodisca vitripennis]|nr:hypothetical protein J6590_048565 [Homalodisca vitripennis]
MPSGPTKGADFNFKKHLNVRGFCKHEFGIEDARSADRFSGHLLFKLSAPLLPLCLRWTLEAFTGNLFRNRLHSSSFYESRLRVKQGPLDRQILNYLSPLQPFARATPLAHDRVDSEAPQVGGMPTALPITFLLANCS